MKPLRKPKIKKPYTGEIDSNETWVFNINVVPENPNTFHNVEELGNYMVSSNGELTRGHCSILETYEAEAGFGKDGSIYTMHLNVEDGFGSYPYRLLSSREDRKYLCGLSMGHDSKHFGYNPHFKSLEKSVLV